MTTFLVVFALCGWIACARTLRRYTALRALSDAQREHIMVLAEDNVRLIEESEKILNLNDRLLGLSVKLVTDADSRSVILPPPGGLVA